MPDRTRRGRKLTVLGRAACLVLGPGLLLVGSTLRIEPWGVTSGAPYVPGATRGAQYTWNANEQSLRWDLPKEEGERIIWHSYSLSRSGLRHLSSHAWYERHEHDLEWFDASTGVFTALSDEERRQIAPQLALYLKHGMGSPFRVDMLMTGVADGKGTYLIGRGVAATALSVAGVALALLSTGMLAAHFLLLIVRQRRFKCGHCCECGYAMGAACACPECGWSPVLKSGYGDSEDREADP